MDQHVQDYRAWVKSQPHEARRAAYREQRAERELAFDAMMAYDPDKFPRLHYYYWLSLWDENISRKGWGTNVDT